jgi:hypothetical protein
MPAARLLAEIKAFYLGYGDSRALRSALREADLIVPTHSGGTVPSRMHEGINWICAFTSELECARFLHEAGTEVVGARYQVLSGARLLDQVVPAMPNQPVGLSIDIVSAQPMAFPPEIDDAAAVM